MDEATLERPEDAGKTEDAKVRFWIDEVALAGKREKAWREGAKKIVSIYEAGRKDTNQFNILYSNTETMSPAIYNTIPRPVVRRRFKDKDPAGLLASKVAERLLEYYLDTNLDGYKSDFEEMVEQVVHETLLVGRGIPWLGLEAGQITTVAVPWEHFRCSYGKRLGDIWWIARLHNMTRDELVDNFGKALGEKVPVSGPEGGEDEGSDNDENRGSLQTAPVWEIWDKRTKQVHFISDCYPQAFLRQVDDPHKRTGFFPCPRQLLWMRKVENLTPVAPYELYEKQAEELNRITLRINKIINVMKVRGAYDATVEGMDKILSQDDGMLSPIENVAALQGGQGKLDAAIWLMPIEKLVVVLQQLYNQREQVKQIIFEITGLADIIRGSSKASETLGAQQIKERWGGLRIRRMQKSVQNLVRAIMRGMLELSVKNIPEEQLYAIVQLPIPTVEQKNTAIQQANAASAAGQRPHQTIMAVAQGPTFSDVIKLLQDDLARSFRVDIETNSTVDVEATEDRQMISEFMQATGQFIQGVSPMVQQGILPFQAAQGMLMAISRRMKFGDEVEEYLEQMSPPQPHDDGKVKLDQQRLQLEQQAKAGELAIRQKELQLEGARLELEKERVLLEREKAALEREQTAMQMAQVQHEMATSERDHTLEREKLQMEWNDKKEERALRQADSVADRELRIRQLAPPEQGSGLQQSLGELTATLTELRANVQEALTDLAAAVEETKTIVTTPKKRTVERDASGMAVSIDGQPLQRDGSGKIIGLG